MVKELTTENFDEEVVNCPTAALVDFWAPWCGPCRRQAPIIEELDKNAADKVNVCKLNIDENMDIAKKYGVMSIPTLILFKNGEPVKKLVGLTALTDLEALLD